jgi:hypothetical protein
MDQWRSEREKTVVLSSDAHGHLVHGGGSLLPIPSNALRRPPFACTTDPIDVGISRNAGFLWTCWRHQLVLACGTGTVALLLRRRPYLHAPYQLWIQQNGIRGYELLLLKPKCTTRSKMPLYLRLTSTHKQWHPKQLCWTSTKTLDQCIIHRHMYMDLKRTYIARK